ncbi:hypothetical protein [Corynebacterium ulcerans]|uniref:DEAD/DEAH box helicase n=1 Tax=Corynebacterium ulcerans TaxID=65058 RepID=A0ABD0BFN5_CORUL|nr:hypothetical protein [Corynebacterium ulcerans]AEG81394.1 hypothetical protein CULC809_00858 [Corynebacterium ulcerans 809]AEG83586.1 hypothetical protein CULC22_00873 [Corynebacterium ulcerans BR-AD22]AIT88856.1 Hypothetical protein Cul210932_0900 [Corynebacterium ulcerans]ALD94632.1 Hypothetical protein Cul131001_0916 [Corynebacterium ulcerans]MBH5298698.1 hypothetical protein [Corynebacterium ulcerans]
MNRNFLAVLFVVTTLVILGVFMVWLVKNDLLEQALKNQESPVTIDVHDTFGDEWQYLAAVCPGDTREAAEKRLGLPSLDTPEKGPELGDNYLVLLDGKGAYESKKYHRAAIDLCNRKVEPASHATFARKGEGWELAATH